MANSLDHVDVRGELTVDDGVDIDTNVIVKGRVHLRSGVSVEANCILEDCEVGAGSSIRANSIVEGATVGRDCIVGPFARVRTGTTIGEGAQIGNFVEVKESTIGPRAKINHHAYVGNASIGRDVIIGAGTITCNFDGRATQATRIGDGAFVGSGCQLVAPIEIGPRAIIGAGSTVTQDAPAEKLTLARGRQITLKGRRSAADLVGADPNDGGE